MTIRPSSRALGLMATTLIPALLPALGWAAAWPLWIAWLGVVILAFCVDFLLMPSGRELELEVADEHRLGIGDRALIPIGVRHLRGMSFDLEIAVDEIEHLRLDAPGRVRVEEGAAEVALAVSAERRAEYRIEGLWLRWSGFLCLAERVELRPAKIAVIVIPNLGAVKANAIHFFSRPEFRSGLKTERYLGDGSEFDNLREFLPGMDNRHLDWKASARHRKLLIREFRAERNHQVVLGVDCGRLMREPLEGMPRLDHAIQAALVLSYCVLKTGDRASLFSFDDQVRLYEEAEGGVQGIHRLQDRAARIGYGTAETNFTLGLTDLSTRLRRRSLVVLITEFSDTISAELMMENLDRLSRRHVVIFVTLRDPELDEIAALRPDSEYELNRCVVVRDLLRERRRVLRELERMGIHTLDARPEELNARLIDRYLAIKRRELV